jgi:hypothetical protein
MPHRAVRLPNVEPLSSGTPGAKLGVLYICAVVLSTAALFVPHSSDDNRSSGYRGAKGTGANLETDNLLSCSPPGRALGDFS